MTAVDFGTVNVSFDGEDVLDANPRSNVSGTLAQSRRPEVPVSAVCWEPGHMRTALVYQEAGTLAADCPWQLVFSGLASPAGADLDPASLMAMVAGLPWNANWSVIWREAEVFLLASFAITMGGLVSARHVGDHHSRRLGTQHQEALLARVALAERLSWPVAGG